MKVIVVDDERFVLTAETQAIKRTLPKADIYPFQKTRDALEFVEANKIDIAFLDINIKGVTGIELAKKLQEYNPQINIIFCTGYSEYSMDALDIYCSAYLMKPITDEKINKALENLRHPIAEKTEKLRAQCFGNFEVYKDDMPIKFKHHKTKELLAFLIDRHGATVSTRDMDAALYEGHGSESYIRNLRADLNHTLEDLGLSEVLIRSGGDMGVNVEKIDCDYYDYLNGHKSLFKGEYMSQYSFAESTSAWLMRTK